MSRVTEHTKEVYIVSPTENYWVKFLSIDLYCALFHGWASKIIKAQGAATSD